MKLDRAYNPVALEGNELYWLIELIRKNHVHKFYTWGKWITERQFVKQQDNNECQQCKRAGRYAPAELVHHIKHLRTHPQLALSMWAEENGVWVRQLESLCKACHEREHPERMRKYTYRPETIVERWD